VTIEIQRPMYFGSDGIRKVGLAEFRLANEGAVTQVKITQCDKNKRLYYPNILCMKTADVIKYPTQMVGKMHKVKCYIVPIQDFQNKKFDLVAPQYYPKHQ